MQNSVHVMRIMSLPPPPDEEDFEKKVAVVFV